MFHIQVRQADGKWKTVAVKKGYGAANMRMHSLLSDGKDVRIVRQ